jgi:hypothetical protein
MARVEELGRRNAVPAPAGTPKSRHREEAKRLRDVERRAKLQEKLDVLEQARLEVERHDSQIAVLLSIHQEPVDPWTWGALIAALDPCAPAQSSLNEVRERLDACATVRTVDAAAIERCRRDDTAMVEQALAAHAADLGMRKRHRELAGRVVRGDLDAWLDAIAQLHPFEELEELGVSVSTEFHSRDSAHCNITVRGPEIIPQEAKTLTSTGKLSVKPMARGRFHEIYQDYVCGSVLRTASEMFGFLPLETVLVTASVGFLDPATGQFGIRPVLSVGFERKAFSQLVLENVDPSDAIDRFTHKGDAKASRKTGSFVPVEPLRFDAFARSPRDTVRFNSALELLRRERDSIREQTKTLTARLRIPHPSPTTEA